MVAKLTNTGFTTKFGSMSVVSSRQIHQAVSQSASRLENLVQEGEELQRRSLQQRQEAQVERLCEALAPM